MWNRKLCFAVCGAGGLSYEEELKTIRATGFEGTFIGWGGDFADRAELVRQTGLELQSVHAPFGKMAAMWADDEEAGRIALTEQLNCLADCARAEAPIMVVHAFIGFNDHTPTPIGLERFGRLVKAAEQTGVKLAFENTEGEEYLAALLTEFGSSEAVGFCWDSGHELCYNRSADLLARYGHLLLGTHLNDNLGVKDFGGEITWIDDLHLLPFDGIADWEYNARRLNRCGFTGPLTFELTTHSKPGRHENDLYGKMTGQEYIAEAYKRACRVAELCRRCAEQP